MRFVIGDVSGHSAYAAALGTALRAGWRAIALGSDDEPGRWVDDLQALLKSETDDPECFATICTGALTAGELCVAVAGHPVPIVVDDDGLRSLPVTASPPFGLGVGPAAQLSVSLRGPFLVFLYTDGVVEGRSAPGSAERFGEEGLVHWLDEHTAGKRFLETDDLPALVGELREANGGPLSDDAHHPRAPGRRVSLRDFASALSVASAARVGRSAGSAPRQPFALPMRTALARLRVWSSRRCPAPDGMTARLSCSLRGGSGCSRLLGQLHFSRGWTGGAS